VITITEFEDTVVREEGEGRESPAETPPESEERKQQLFGEPPSSGCSKQ